MKLRIISILLVLTMVFSVLAGCNKNEKEPIEDLSKYSISLNRTEITLEVGDSRQIYASITPDPTSPMTITWRSTNSSVAYVNDGTIVALAEGTAVVEACLDNGKVAHCKVNVVESEGSGNAGNNNPGGENNNQGGGNNNPTPNPGGYAGYNDEPVTITFYHAIGVAQQSILNDAIAEFNKLYPNITVEHESYGYYDGVRDQIKIEITVGDQPNMAYCYSDHIVTYNQAYAVKSLDDLISSSVEIERADGTTEMLGFTQEQLDDFIEGFYNEGKCLGDDKMYSLPISKSTEVLYYNKTFFEENGLQVPTTWDEMAAVCEQIKAIDPSCIPLGYDSESNWFITMCEQYGSPYTSATGDNFLFDNATNRNFVKMFREWYQKGWVTTEELYGGYTSALFTGDSWNDSSTRCYMSIASTGGAAYQQPNSNNGVYEFEVGITSIPQVNPAQPKVISQGPSICIFNGHSQAETEATWLFAKFLATNVEFQARMSMTNGYAPVIKSVAENEIYANFLASASTENIKAYAVKVAIEQQDAYFNTPAFNGSSVARYQVGFLIQKCFTLEADDVDAAIKKAFEESVAECRYQAGY